MSRAVRSTGRTIVGSFPGTPTTVPQEGKRHPPPHAAEDEVRHDRGPRPDPEDVGPRGGRAPPAPDLEAAPRGPRPCAPGEGDAPQGADTTRRSLTPDGNSSED